MHKSVEAGRQSDSLATCLFMPHVPHATCCKRADTHTAGSLARFMFNEMFGRFLENLHYTATTGPVAGRQPGLPLLPVHLLPPSPCTCLCLKKCTKWRALSARQLVVPLSSFILPVQQGNRIFVAGKRDCQVFHCTGALSPPLPIVLWQWGHA